MERTDGEWVRLTLLGGSATVGMRDHMADSDLNELKRRLRAAGFEVYRTRDALISLAERVRDNLILDSGISVGLVHSGPEQDADPASLDETGRLFHLRVTLRAQASHFPGASSEAVAEQAEALAATFLEAGYSHGESRISNLPDPAHPERSLDTSHEVVVSREIAGLEGLFDTIRAAFAHPRASGDDD
ncbi:MAG TPA: hypothetical protein VLC09_08535 [Polyangiaceae bacterium]|nr:hypothetical protein [Polyangiaceae bacterium]